jgi:DNA-directed RNA polymerase subunit RPC12/RpoP
MTHFFENRVICPHCGYAYSVGDIATMPGYVTGSDQFEEVCVQCGKKFIVKRTLTEMFETEKKEVPS